jgi:hypothetical protein
MMARNGDEPRGLASVAQDALDSKEGEEIPAGQETLIPAWRAKFLGTQLDSFEDDMPEIGDEMRCEVVGVVIGQEKTRRKDGEIREVVKVEVTSVKSIS